MDNNSDETCITQFVDSPAMIYCAIMITPTRDRLFKNGLYP